MATRKKTAQTAETGASPNAPRKTGRNGHQNGHGNGKENNGKENGHQAAARASDPAGIGAAPWHPSQTVLVLQGGGALGAYHAGVYHALHEGGLEPDWIIGSSIGAINGALIAGNPR